MSDSPGQNHATDPSDTAAAAAPTPLMDAVTDFTRVLTKNVLARVLGPDALAQVEKCAKGGSGSSMMTSMGPPKGGISKQARKKRTKKDKYTSYNLFVTLACHHVSWGHFQNAAACWGSMAPEVKATVLERLDAIRGTVNERAKQLEEQNNSGGGQGAGGKLSSSSSSGSVDKVHVAEILAKYERDNDLQPLNWLEVLAPYKSTPMTGGRKKKAPAGDAAADAHTAGGQQQQQQVEEPQQQPASAKKQKKKHKQAAA